MRLQSFVTAESVIALPMGMAPSWLAHGLCKQPLFVLMQTCALLPGNKVWLERLVVQCNCMAVHQHFGMLLMTNLGTANAQDV